MEEANDVPLSKGDNFTKNRNYKSKTYTHKEYKKHSTEWKNDSVQQNYYSTISGNSQMEDELDHQLPFSRTLRPPRKSVRRSGSLQDVFPGIKISPRNSAISADPVEAPFKPIEIAPQLDSTTDFPALGRSASGGNLPDSRRNSISEHPRQLSSENLRKLSSESPRKLSLSSDNPRKLSSEHPRKLSFSNEVPRRMSSENPRKLSSENPRKLSSENTRKLSSENLMRLSNDIPRRLSTEIPRRLSSEQPRIISSESPRKLSNEQPRKLSAEQPRNLSNETVSPVPRRLSSENPRRMSNATRRMSLEIPRKMTIAAENPPLIINGAVAMDAPNEGKENSEALMNMAANWKKASKPINMQNASKVISNSRDMSSSFLTVHPMIDNKPGSRRSYTSVLSGSLPLGTASGVRSSKNRFVFENDKKREVTLEEELRQVLSNQQKLLLFKNFLNLEFSAEALQFYLEAESFKNDFYVNPNANAKLANEIFMRYLDPESNLQVNIDSDIRQLITERLQSNAITEKMFAEAQSVIFDLMKNDSFRRFRVSLAYLNFLDHQEVEAVADTAQSEEEEKEKNNKFARSFGRQFKNSLLGGSNSNLLKELNVKQPWKGTACPSCCKLVEELLRILLRLFKKHVGVHLYDLEDETHSLFNHSKSSHSHIQFLKDMDAIKADPEYQAFSQLVCQVQKANLASMKTHKEKLSFFINLYNTICLHALVDFSANLSSIHRLEFFKKASYKIDGFSFSMFEIEHAILRHSMSKPNFGAIKVKTPKFSKSDPRFRFTLAAAEALISFALFVPHKSSPSITIYTPENVHQKLVLVTKEYFEREVQISGFDTYDSKKVIKLPKGLYWYYKDFAPLGTDAQLLNFVATYLPAEMQSKVKFFLNSVKPKYRDYQFEFSPQHIISKDIMDAIGLSVQTSKSITERKQEELQNEIEKLSLLREIAIEKEDYKKEQELRDKITELRKALRQSIREKYQSL
eukprot:TRINITY_DN5752_c0_g1_i1.p1 TRINITY_DN5752_c0_g1~~TRINITY_DN5752_c0_g1_i1.p1  ORF type:complete len:974 (-),score=271.17 TRINITY_DN5752_c0_g1_i1:285-3206(-)